MTRADVPLRNYSFTHSLPSLFYNTPSSEKQQNGVVARKPRDAAAVLFGLKFAYNYNIHYKFKSSQASKARLQLQTYRRKTEFNAKWPFKAIQGHVFWSQWKADKGLNNTI